MPTVTRLTSNGVFQSLGGFDEVSLNSGSIKFSGTDWLTLANTAALQIPTADFTVETFVYCNTFVATGNGQILLGKGLVGTGTYEHNFILANSSGNMFLQFGYSTTGSNQIFLNSSTIPITLNSWNHLAYTRTGTNLTFWFNGVSYGTFTVPSTMFTSSGLISIASNSTGAYNPLNGYISNLRFVNGTNLYTSNFRPPTSPLLPIANTALLLSVDPQNPFGDSSVNNLTITKNGNPQFNTLGPFYYPANTSINLANTNNNPILGSNTNIITSTTSNGVVMISNEFDEVSMSSGSLYFNGSSQLVSSNNNNLAFGTNDFTIEYWVYPTNIQPVVAAQLSSGSLANTTSWQLGINSGLGTMSFAYNSGTSINGTTVLQVNNWYHVAVTRNSGNVRVFLNGIQEASVTATNNYSENFIKIGNSRSPGNYFSGGHLSNIRFVNGAALYTANFAPPQMVLSSVTNANTVLLLNNFAAEPFVDNSDDNIIFPTNNGVTANTFSPFTNTQQKVLNTGTMMTKEYDEWTGVPVVDSSLKLWLDAGQPASYPGSGTTWTNLSGNGNNGTLTNGPTYTSSNGGSIVFDGTDDYVTSSFATTSGQAVTYAGWLYSTETTSTYKNFVDSVSQNPMIWWNTSGQIEFDAASYTTTTVYRNQWVYVALSKPAGSSAASYYVNGILVGTGSAYTTPTVTPTWFNRGTSQTWKGNCSQFSTYNRALSAAEVQQNFNALRGRYGI